MRRHCCSLRSWSCAFGVFAIQNCCIFRWVLAPRRLRPACAHVNSRQESGTLCHISPGDKPYSSSPSIAKARIDAISHAEAASHRYRQGHDHISRAVSDPAGNLSSKTKHCQACSAGYRVVTSFFGIGHWHLDILMVA